MPDTNRSWGDGTCLVPLTQTPAASTTAKSPGGPGAASREDRQGWFDQPCRLLGQGSSGSKAAVSAPDAERTPLAPAADSFAPRHDEDHLASSFADELAEAMTYTPEEARHLTEKMRRDAKAFSRLLEVAHGCEVWLPMGYPDFETYARREFGLNTERAYGILHCVREVRDAEERLAEAYVRLERLETGAGDRSGHGSL